MPQTLTIRALNRATLARQHLLERVALPPVEALTRLAGRQAQQAAAPYVGLWTRLAGFDRDGLAQAITDRSVVKATMMRATLHLVTAQDYVRWRTTLQPVLTAAAEGIARERGATIDTDRLLELTRDFLAEGPRTFAEITAMLEAALPDGDVRANRYAVRTHLPLVQVPTDTRWSFPGNPAFTLAETWLDRPVDPAPDRPGLIRRYLGAFGPAGVTDLQTWSGLTDVGPDVEALRDELVVFRVGTAGAGASGRSRRELFDLPDAPRPGEDAEAPPRFLGEFDDLLLAHAERSRVVADEHRRAVYRPGLRVASTILVDGVVAGTWAVAVARREATLTVTPFAALPAAARRALEAEGAALVRFLEPSARSHAVRFEES